jgi:hypothetical protein
MLQGGELSTTLLQSGFYKLAGWFEHYCDRLFATQSERFQLAEVILELKIEKNQKRLNSDTTNG